MKKNKKPLALRKETVRDLVAHELTNAVGGLSLQCTEKCPTQPSVCPACGTGTSTCPM